MYKAINFILTLQCCKLKYLFYILLKNYSKESWIGPIWSIISVNLGTWLPMLWLSQEHHKSIHSNSDQLSYFTQLYRLIATFPLLTLQLQGFLLFSNLFEQTFIVGWLCLLNHLKRRGDSKKNIFCYRIFRNYPK